ELPHDLVAAFRATLSEARDADLLLHITDAADTERDVLISVVNGVLDEIGAGGVPQLMVFNKIDCSTRPLASIATPQARRWRYGCRPQAAPASSFCDRQSANASQARESTRNCGCHPAQDACARG